MTELAVTSGRGEPLLTKLPLLRRAMVRQMVQGAAVPCFYLRLTADVTGLIAARAAVKGAAGPDEVIPSVNDFVVRAVAMTLREHPEVNSSFGEVEIATYPRVNVGLAIAVPGGLVVPAIYDADRLSVTEIAVAARDLVGLAERRKLTRELLADATFTVSNLGMYGIEDFDPIINPPQAGILAVGAASADRGDRLRLRLTLGCDHRALTGAEAAPFLTGVRDRLQSPADLLAAPANDDQE
jgi:pyruvate dehydrogenase E2 component (dihydrolipoyllysine-residue acetyltransferase)